VINRRELLAGGAAILGTALVPRSVRALRPGRELTREQFAALLGHRFYVFVDRKWWRLHLLEVREVASGPDVEQFSLILGPWHRRRSRYSSRSRPDIPEGLHDFYNRQLGWFPLFVQGRDEGRYEAIFSLLQDGPRLP
jgi:hypothetical protein